MEMRSGAPAGSAALQCSPSHSTTFVHADAATFKELVQRLTGPRAGGGPGVGAGSEDHNPHPPPSLPLPPHEALSSSSTTKLAGAKRLHERRQAFRPKLAIVKPAAGSQSLPATPAGFLSPAMSPLVLSPSAHFATLNITCDRLIRGSSNTGGGGAGDQLAAELNEEEEERAIKERRFYLHPSPRSRTRIAEPELLPLFPMASSRLREP